MTEILTESFCERCGTRYTFESNAPRRSRVGRVRTLSKGVRNFVLSDDSSFSEAMADARSEEELSATAHQLDAFHKTFNFCLTCRQYTCETCWNPTDGRCLTCAPMAGVEIPDEHVHEIAAGPDGHAQAEMDEAWPEADLERINAVLGHPPAPESLDSPGPAPSVAAEPAREAGADDLTGIIRPQPAAADTVPEPEPDSSQPAASQPAAAVGPGNEAPPGPLPAPSEAAAGPHDGTDADWAAATAAAADASGVDLIGIAPGQSLEDAIAAYESRLAEQERAEAEAASRAQAETAPALEAEVSPAAESPTPEMPASGLPVAAAQAGAPEAPGERPTDEDALAAARDLAASEAHETQPAEAHETQPAEAPEAPIAPPPAPTPTDVIAQPTWPAPPASQPTSDGMPAPKPVSPEPPAARPAEPPASTPGQGPATPSAPWLRVAPDNDGGTAPQWPTTPAWPAASGREMPTTLAGRPLLPRDEASALWAASAREVLGPTPSGGPAPAATASPQPCVQCGLSLSANARFCRRCGSRQG